MNQKKWWGNITKKEKRVGKFTTQTFRLRTITIIIRKTRCGTNPKGWVQNMQVIPNRTLIQWQPSKSLSPTCHLLSKKRRIIISVIHSRNWSKVRKTMLRGIWIESLRDMFGSIRLVRASMTRKFITFNNYRNRPHNCFKNLLPRKSGLSQIKTQKEQSNYKTVTTNTGI